MLLETWFSSCSLFCWLQSKFQDASCRGFGYILVRLPGACSVLFLTLIFRYPPVAVASYNPHHIPDHYFGIAPEQPLPFSLVHRLLSLESAGPFKRFESADLYGGIDSYAYYFVSILVGTPPQRQSVIVDSGSSLLGFPCRNCPFCGKNHMDLGFDFDYSQTARWLSCHDPQCITGLRCGKDDICSYQQSYSEGSSIEGSYFSDMISLGEEKSNNSFVRFDYIGCHRKETNLFVSQRANGIMGVSYPKRGRQETLIDALFRAPDVDTKMFAICVAEEGGLMSIGGYNSSLHRPSRTSGSPTLRMLDTDMVGKLEHEPTSQLQRLLEETTKERRLDGNSIDQSTDETSNVLSSKTTVINNATTSIAWTSITSDSVYQIDVSEIVALDQASRSDTTEIRIASASDLGPCIIDSGTTYSYLSPSVFRTFIKILSDSCTTKTASFCNKLCWNINSPHMFDLLPSFLFKLREGSIIEWRAHSYLSRQGHSNSWCIAVDNNHRPTTILGMSFIKQKNIIFDRERDLLGFADANCPSVPDDSRPPSPEFYPSATPKIREPSQDFEVKVVDHEKNNWVLWTAANLFIVLGVLATGAISIKTLYNRSQYYERMESNIGTTSIINDVETGFRRESEQCNPLTDSREPEGHESEHSRSLTYTRQGPEFEQLTYSCEEDRRFDPSRYDAVEAELDALEMATQLEC